MVRTMKLVTDQNILKHLENEEQVSKPQNKSLLDKIASVADTFNKGVEATHLPQFAGGLLQGAGDVAASLGNVVARPLGHPIPHPNLKQYIPSGFGSQVAFGGGELASQIPLMLGGAGLLAKAGLGAKAGIGGQAAQGAISGALMGENEEGGGRLLGALMGGAIPAGLGLGKKALSLRSKNIAEKVLDTLSSSQKEYGNTFNTILNEAKNRGAYEHFLPIKANEKLLEKAGNKDYLYALKEYNKNPNLGSAHEAQSQLGAYIRDIGKPTSTLDRHAKEEAKKLAKNIREHISEQLSKSGNSDLAMDYSMARKGYKEEVAPYLQSKAVKSLLEGHLLPSKFLPKIAQEDKFIAQIGQYRHPEIQQAELIKKLLNNKIAHSAAGLGLGGLGLYGLQNLLK